MSKALLGPTIDLHTGGVDLLFPHHENEIAQSQCCNGVPFSRHWYHSEHLLVDGKKMSKSLGNLYTLDQLREMGHSPMALRYVLVSGHPRKQLNFTLDALDGAEKALATLRNYRGQLLANGGAAENATAAGSAGILPADGAAAQQAAAAAGGDDGSYGSNGSYGTDGMAANNAARQAAAVGGANDAAADAAAKTRGDSGKNCFARVLDALRDDLNTPAALGALFTVIHEKPADARLADFDQVIFVLGLNLEAPKRQAAAVPAEIRQLAERRWAAKQKKDFALADELRRQIAAAGWAMHDRKDGYSLESGKR
jgi:cysteinyl-tRNA synthetase